MTGRELYDNFATICQPIYQTVIAGWEELTRDASDHADCWVQLAEYVNKQLNLAIETTPASVLELPYEKRMAIYKVLYAAGCRING